MEYNEYRGVRGLVIAEMLTDNSTSSYTSEEWQELSGVQSVGLATSESSEAKFYDNIAAITVNSEGADTLSLVVSVLNNQVKALIEGTSYNSAKSMLIGTPKQKKYFALGFIGKKTDGTEEINIFYKGTFTGGDETNNTEDDGTEGTNVTYTFTAIHTASKIYTVGTGDAAVSKNVKRVKLPITATVTEADIFGSFTAGVSNKDVLTPNEIIALT